MGRATEIEKILKRGAGQVAKGKPIAIFVQGEYGIGKSSIAVFTQAAAAQNYGLHPIYLQLGGAQSLEEVCYGSLRAGRRSCQVATSSRRSAAARASVANRVETFRPASPVDSLVCKWSVSCLRLQSPQGDLIRRCHHV